MDSKKHSYYQLMISLFIVCLFSLNTLYSQNKHPYASNKPMHEPKKFEISGIKNAAQITFTPDGNTFYLLTGGDTTEVIFYSKFENNKWSTPKSADFLGKYRVETPSISPNGKKFFFTKLKVNGEQFTTDICVMNKSKSGWGEPVKLDSSINSPYFNSFPSSAANGNLYFISARNGKSQIYLSRFVNNSYSQPELLDSVVNINNPSDSYISPDESYILFRASNTPNTYELYISFNENGRWLKPQNLGKKINFNDYQGRPYISPDGNYLFYASASTKDWISSQYQVDLKPILDSLRTTSK